MRHELRVHIARIVLQRRSKLLDDVLTLIEYGVHNHSGDGRKRDPVGKGKDRCQANITYERTDALLS